MIELQVVEYPIEWELKEFKDLREWDFVSIEGCLYMATGDSQYPLKDPNKYLQKNYKGEREGDRLVNRNRHKKIKVAPVGTKLIKTK